MCTGLAGFQAVSLLDHLFTHRGRALLFVVLRTYHLPGLVFPLCQTEEPWSDSGAQAIIRMPSYKIIGHLGQMGLSKHVFGVLRVAMDSFPQKPGLWSFCRDVRCMTVHPLQNCAKLKGLDALTANHVVIAA